MSDSPVDFRPDGGIAFAIDDKVKIVWRPPKVKHVRTHRNAYQTLVTESQEKVAPFRPPEDSDEPFEVDVDAYQVAKDEIDATIAGWIKQVHKSLRLDGSLPSDPDEWPVWLPTLQFAGAVVKHWSQNPFN